jgi:hypothetical protein
MNEKHCSMCDTILPIESFYVVKNKSSRRCYCKDCCSKLTLKYQKENHDKILNINRKSKKKNWDKHKKEVTLWRKNNPEKVKIYARRSNAKARQSLPRKIRDRISSGIVRALKGRKVGKTFEILPYTQEQVIKHLIKTLPRGYTIQDFMAGKLHLDHKIPVSAFNITDEKCIDFQKCWELKNLRLLPAKDNLVKWAKLDRPFQPSLGIAL